MDTTAVLRYLRMSPRKVRLVADLVRGLPVERATHVLAFTNRASARPLYKLLQSAIANAENNNKLKRENLFIKQIYVNAGPVLKRWRQRAFGRAAMIQKRSAHIHIVLGELSQHAGKKKVARSRKPAPHRTAAKAAEQKVVDFQDIKHEAKGKQAAVTPEGQQKKPIINFKSIKEKFSRRLGER